MKKPEIERLQRWAAKIRKSAKALIVAGRMPDRDCYMVGVPTAHALFKTIFDVRMDDLIR